MSCCNHKSETNAPGGADYAKRPEDQCVFCAEKHAGTAYALACEVGYRAITRQRIIGELSLAAWHVWDINRPLAERIREVRHAVQLGDQPKWKELMSSIDKAAGIERKG